MSRPPDAARASSSRTSSLPNPTALPRAPSAGASMDAFSPPPPPGEMDHFSPPPAPVQLGAFSPPPPPAQTDAFSPATPPGQPDAFSPPPPDRGTTTSKSKRRRRTPVPPVLRSKPAVPHTGAREVSDAELFGNSSTSPPSSARRSRSSASIPNASLGREVCDTELFSSFRVRGGGSSSAAIGREVRDSELFNALRGSTSAAHEVHDSELFNISAPVVKRARVPKPSRVARAVLDRGFESADRDCSSSLTRRRERSPTTRCNSRPHAPSASADCTAHSSDSVSRPSAPKRPRRIAPWESSRADLVAAGITVTYPTVTESNTPYAPLPWRAGRDPADASRLGGVKRLSELSLEMLRVQVRHGQTRDLSALPDDFVFALLASDGIDAGTLSRVEQYNPHLAPVIEAAWARLCKLEALPEHFKSWRHMHEFGEDKQRQALEEARQRVRASYERERNGTRASHRVVVSEYARPPPVRRRRENAEPQSALARLRDQHRRARRR